MLNERLTTLVLINILNSILQITKFLMGSDIVPDVMKGATKIVLFNKSLSNDSNAFCW